MILISYTHHIYSLFCIIGPKVNDAINNGGIFHFIVDGTVANIIKHEIRRS